jgi:hypothetical protein
MKLWIFPFLKLLYCLLDDLFYINLYKNKYSFNHMDNIHMDTVLETICEIIKQNDKTIHITDKQREIITNYTKKRIGLYFEFCSYNIRGDESDKIKREIENSDLIKTNSFVTVIHEPSYGYDGHSNQEGLYRIKIGGFLQNDYTENDLKMHVIRTVCSHMHIYHHEHNTTISLYNNDCVISLNNRDILKLIQS